MELCRHSVTLVAAVVASVLLGIASVPAQHLAWYKDDGPEDSYKPAARLDPTVTSLLPINDDPSRAVRITLIPDKPRAKPGDELVLRAEADRDCHMTVLAVSASGELTVLWPNRTSGWENRVIAGRPVLVSGQGAGITIRVDWKSPFERILAYGSTQRDLFFDARDFDVAAGGTVKTFSRDVGEFSRSFRAKTESLPPRSAWGTAELIIPVASSLATETDTSLPMTRYPQETKMWCWAASAQMAMHFLGVSVPQPAQANARLGRNDCDKIALCPSPVQNHKCVKGGWPEFPKYGFTFKKTNKSPLSWDQLKDQVSRKKPICFSWGWQGGGGHMMVVNGYLEKEGKKYVRILDPWPPCKGDSKIVTYEHYCSSPGKHVHWDDYYDLEPKASKDRD